MNIEVRSGVGAGPTKLAAFDAALLQAGVANFNLICLSSVIPAGSSVAAAEGSGVQVDGDWGDRLYVVMADNRVDTPNEEAWAGLGWMQEPESGRGLIVEHYGGSEASVRRNIEETLRALFEARGMSHGPMGTMMRGVTCAHEPVCALVVAVFQRAGWAG